MNLSINRSLPLFLQKEILPETSSITTKVAMVALFALSLFIGYYVYLFFNSKQPKSFQYTSPLYPTSQSNSPLIEPTSKTPEENFTLHKTTTDSKSVLSKSIPPPTPGTPQNSVVKNQADFDYDDDGYDPIEMEKAIQESLQEQNQDSP